jgi:D-alanine-D-alanine ligase-like ATP-grasp enzyme
MPFDVIWMEVEMAKMRVGIVFGGKSAEHEVSLQSAKNIVEAIDKSRFDVVLLGIDKQGLWHINDAGNYLLNAQDPARIALRPSTVTLAQIPGREAQQLINADSGQPLAAIDVISPSSTARWAKMAPCRDAAHGESAFRRFRCAGLRGLYGQRRDQTSAARCRARRRPVYH